MGRVTSPWSPRKVFESDRGFVDSTAGGGIGPVFRRISSDGRRSTTRPESTEEADPGPGAEVPWFYGQGVLDGFYSQSNLKIEEDGWQPGSSASSENYTFSYNTVISVPGLWQVTFGWEPNYTESDLTPSINNGGNTDHEFRAERSGPWGQLANQLSAVVNVDGTDLGWVKCYLTGAEGGTGWIAGHRFAPPVPWNEPIEG